MKKLVTPIGFIGCGNMARAIIEALHTKGYGEIWASDPSPAQLERVWGIAKTFAGDNQSVVSACKYLFICVKPQAAEQVLSALDFSPDKVPISIMAGIPLAKFRALTKAKKVVRVMPNLNAAVKLSHNAYCFENLTQREQQRVFSLLNAFGMPFETDEGFMNAVTGISGSGPAYVFRFIQGLMMAAEKSGIPAADAAAMCCNMVRGSVLTALGDLLGETPIASYQGAYSRLDEKVKPVCSKGGTTIKGIEHLDRNNFAGTVCEAAGRAIKRAEELSEDKR
ncbi:MAG: pyrroline-5-carboxylate reductase [Firmicutes bacterium]|nr:pyrroline-5-carboxylate reductase [Bacillota bacterium]